MNRAAHILALALLLRPWASQAEIPQSVASQPLADALESFARSRGYQLVYRAELTAGLRSSGAGPGLSPAEALRELLRGSSLNFKFINDKTIVLFRPAEDPTAANRPPPTSGEGGDTFPRGDADPFGRQHDLPNTAAGLQEILVTARKRSENLQDVPVAITSIDAGSIRRVSAISLTDLSGMAPSLSLQNFAIFPFNLTAVVRGIGTADFEPSSDPAVALIIDGVPQAASNGAPIELLDLESVEILRGPQGTLFGRNATAGAILIRSKRPQNDWGLEAQATAGSYGQLDIAGTLTGPIITNLLAFRLAVADRNLDGYFHNEDGRRLGKIDRYSMRSSFLYTPTTALSALVSAEYTDDRSQTTPGINGLSSTGGHVGANSSDYDTTVNEALHYESTAKSITLNAEYQSRIGTYTLIANARQFGYSGNFDVDGNPSTVLAIDRLEGHRQESAELRFSTSSDQRVSATAGALILEHRYDLRYDGRSSTLVPGFDPVDPGIPLLIIDNSQAARSSSLYAQGTLRINTQWSIDVGVNYGHEKKTFDFNQATVFAVPATPGIFDKSWGNLGPKLGANFKVAHTLFYGSYSRGFRSGGFSGRAFDPRTLGPYAPEHVDAYEIGVKSDLLDDSVRVDFATYYNRYKDLQRPFSNLVGYNGSIPNPLELITFNAAGADIKGAEAEVTALPGKGWTLVTSLAYLQAKYNGFADPTTGASLDNLKLVYAPPFTGRVSAIYHEELTPAWFSELSVDYAHSSSLETDTLNAPVGRRAATNLINATVTLGQAKGPLKLTFWVKNLTDDVYVVSAQTGDPYFSIFSVDPPRTYGMTLSARF